MGGVQVAMVVGLVAATPVASRTERAMKTRPTWVAASFCGGEWTAAFPAQVSCGVSSTRTAAGLTQDEKCSTPGDEAKEFTAQVACSTWPAAALEKTLTKRTPLELLRSARDGMVVHGGFVLDPSAELGMLIDNRAALRVSGKTNTGMPAEVLLVLDVPRTIMVVALGHGDAAGILDSVGRVGAKQARPPADGLAPATTTPQTAPLPGGPVSAPLPVEEALPLGTILRNAKYSDVMQALRDYPCEKKTYGDYLDATFKSPDLLAYPDADGTCVLGFEAGRLRTCTGCNPERFHCRPR